MSRQLQMIGLLAVLLSPAAWAGSGDRVAVELLLVAATLAAMLVITWRRRFTALARKRARSRKNKRP